jgi:chitinase
MNLILLTASLLLSSAFSNNGNIPPTANAGEDMVVSGAEFVQLDGTSSREPDGIISRYHWVQTAGKPVEIVNAGAAITALNNIQKGAYSFRLTVMDDKGGVSSDEVRIEVK